MVTTVKLHPAWRQAEKEMLERGFTYGSRVEKAELTRLFNLKEPLTAREQNAFNVAFMTQLLALRRSLLRNHQIALRTIWGDSTYEAVMPNEQTSFAMRSGAAELKKAMRTMRDVLVNTPMHLLTAEEQRKNADAQSRVAMLASLTTRRALIGKI